jgi:HSP20 family protein
MPNFSLSPVRSVFSPLSLWDDDDFLPLKSINNGLEVKETKKTVIVKANVAGVSADDIEVTFDKGVLWIQAKAQDETQDEEEKYYSRSSWNYSYRLSVPGRINRSDEPKVSLKDGVLKVEFQKEEIIPPKKLKVEKK